MGWKAKACDRLRALGAKLEAASRGGRPIFDRADREVVALMTDILDRQERRARKPARRPQAKTNTAAWAASRG